MWTVLVSLSFLRRKEINIITMKLIAIFQVIFIHSVWGHFNGPFVFFGHDKLNEMGSSVLSEPDPKFLIDLYNKAPAIIIFTRNISTKLTDDNFPTFKDLLSQTTHTYLTSHQLNVDPIEYNVNTEVRSKPMFIKMSLNESREHVETTCHVFVHLGGEFDWTIVSTRCRDISSLSGCIDYLWSWQCVGHPFDKWR